MKRLYAIITIIFNPLIFCSEGSSAHTSLLPLKLFLLNSQHIGGSTFFKKNVELVGAVKDPDSDIYFTSKTKEPLTSKTHYQLLQEALAQGKPYTVDFLLMQSTRRYLKYWVVCHDEKLKRMSAQNRAAMTFTYNPEKLAFEEQAIQQPVLVSQPAAQPPQHFQQPNSRTTYRDDRSVTTNSSYDYYFWDCGSTSDNTGCCAGDWNCDLNCPDISCPDCSCPDCSCDCGDCDLDCNDD